MPRTRSASRGAFYCCGKDKYHSHTPQQDRELLLTINVDERVIPLLEKIGLRRIRSNALDQIQMMLLQEKKLNLDVLDPQEKRILSVWARYRHVNMATIQTTPNLSDKDALETLQRLNLIETIQESGLYMTTFKNTRGKELGCLYDIAIFIRAMGIESMGSLKPFWDSTHKTPVPPEDKANMQLWAAEVPLPIQVYASKHHCNFRRPLTENELAERENICLESRGLPATFEFIDKNDWHTRKISLDRDSQHCSQEAGSGCCSCCKSSSVRANKGIGFTCVEGRLCFNRYVNSMCLSTCQMRHKNVLCGNNLEGPSRAEVWRNDPFNNYLSLEATMNMPADTVVCEYTGEIKALKAWHGEPDTAKGDYAMEVDMKPAGKKSKNTEVSLIIDASRKGSKARYANHSCDPNCRLEGVFVECRKIWVLRTNRPVEKYEELVWNYSWESRDISKLQEICLCNSEKCTGKLYRPMEDTPIQSGMGSTPRSSTSSNNVATTTAQSTRARARTSRAGPAVVSASIATRNSSAGRRSLAVKRSGKKNSSPSRRRKRSPSTTRSAGSKKRRTTQPTS
ncbi:lysine N-methyltransferase, H3 lysine-4 specific [Seminavis robusta]|uniref:Lysine N-methyltransferase, H3 lysine-4 specific n=1 Tax=Seminavis robusta TaxID=568900 RepID=A0A9N8DEX4_9STRA|nr:lysine N-methyltransferase, H3 lysine-4 specific [Seminavis robusta]|eukprot:Sro117_g057310.1 lysine N-methyltransferase, H3 lysine-4 specific (567) ;mRNA; f:27696-29396